MNIDKRYVEILANNTPRARSKKNARLAVGGFLVMMAGMVFYAAGNLYGLAIMAVGFLLIVISMVKQKKIQNEARKEFMGYYEKNGTLPPFPEEGK